MKEKKQLKRVAVLMGGPSAEREVSLKSGVAVAGGLRDSAYEVREIDVTDVLPALPEDIDGVFIALHGTYGEDGGVQRALEALGIPYTGARPAACQLTFDKALCQAHLAARDVPTAPSEVIGRGQKPTLPLPLVIKPCRQGSSIGISCVHMESEMAPALELAFQFDERVLAESYVPGRELTAGVVDGVALPIVEIKAPAAWYNYDAKYASQATEYRVPAPLSDALRDHCQALALRAYHACACRGMARIDFRLRPDGNVFALEVNTIPGFTATSLLPKAAKAMGWSFSELCDRVMKTAWLD